jgi:coenzyme PQQ precursor peptide PqqA
MRQAPALRPALFTGDLEMQWETPTAIDFRFGFEITLYVAAR